jgi:phospholipid/cholesterol/gamma-HCH transport system substrate-binding protein
MDERRLEVKVGALVLIGVAGVLGLLYLMGELVLSKEPSLQVLFSHTGNVVPGAPVKLAGVAVGRVEAITLEHQRRDERGLPLPVRMFLSLDAPTLAALHQDAAVTVATVGPLGEPYLELWPGSEDAPPLSPGAILRGTDAPRLDVVALRLSRFLEAGSRLLEENPRAFEDLLTSVSSLTRSVDGLLGENQGELSGLAGELAAAVRDMRALAALARRTLEPGGKGDRLLDDAAASARVLRRDVPHLSEDARRLLAHLATLSGQLQEEDLDKLKVAIDRYSAAGEKLDRLAARGERILEHLEPAFDPDGGTLGALANDPQLYEDLRALVSDLRKHPWKILWKD